MSRLSVLCGIVFAIVSGAASAADVAKLPLTLHVTAGAESQSDARVSFRLPESLANETNLRLIETTSGRDRPIAVQGDAAGRLWWIAGGTTPSGGVRTYRLEAGAPAAEAAVQLVNSEQVVEARAGGKQLLRYNKAHVEPPVGVNAHYGRSAHFHPVQTPGGAVVTDELPPDHLHQSGIFLAYTKAKFAGRNVDFWNLGGGKGRVRFKGLTSTSSGPVFSEFVTEHDHVDLSADPENTDIGRTTGGQVALNEQWIVRVWSVNPNADYWLMDIASTQTCATENPLILPEYHYGGMAIRAAREWTPGKVTFLTSAGDDRIQGNHTRPKWCDVRGEVNGVKAGIALMTHPSNFRFPEPLRIHPTMPYMVYTPSFLGDWEIKPGQPHHAQYRWVVHDGGLSTETLERLWRDFAEPLEAVMQ